VSDADGTDDDCAICSEPDCPRRVTARKWREDEARAKAADVPSAPRHDAGTPLTQAVCEWCTAGDHAPCLALRPLEGESAPCACVPCGQAWEREALGRHDAGTGDLADAILLMVYAFSDAGRKDEVRALADRARGLAADVERLTKQNAAVFEANERLSAQLAASSSRYARAVAEWDEVRGRLVAERDEAQAGYHALDRNWQTVHSMAMDPIRAAVGLPDGTVPEIVEAIREARGKALEEAIGAAMSLADSTACHPAARRSLEVLCGRLRALAAPAAKGGA